jgi:putative acetyltransferase
MDTATSIRPEEARDADAIHAVHVVCFPADAEARLVGLLRAAGRLIVSLVAEVQGTVVGHVAFSPVTAADGSVGAGLAPVAVVEAHRRRGVAAALIQSGLERCRAAGFGWAVVLGDPGYYARFGFCPAAGLGLSDEYGGGPAFQIVELVAGAVPAGAGIVRYSSEFASLE